MQSANSMQPGSSRFGLNKKAVSLPLAKRHYFEQEFGYDNLFP
jgi:hypothetical protein